MGSSILAIVAIGSNLGDPQENVARAVERLRELSDEPLRASSLWRTTPVDCPPGAPAFVNAVVVLVPRPAETPESLLSRLQALEKEFGRQPKKVANEARPLDLDLIMFGSEFRQGAFLTLPHPRTCERRFVLEPLAEILPGLTLPGRSKAVSELLALLPPDPFMARVDTATGPRARGRSH